MNEFLFLRHGETDWNAQGRMQGQIAHVPLNAKGIAQAQKAADLLVNRGLDLIISSTLDRAAQTAKIIEEKTRAPIVYHEGLIERCWGLGEGLMREEILDKPDDFFMPDAPPDFVSNSRQPKGAETRDELAQRAMGAVSEILKVYEGKRLLLVTHGAWMRALVFHMTGQDQIFANATPYKAAHENGMWQISPWG